MSAPPDPPYDPPYDPINDAVERRRRMVQRVAWSLRTAGFVFLLFLLAGFSGWMFAPGWDYLLKLVAVSLSGEQAPPPAELQPLTVDYAGVMLRIPRGSFEYVPGQLAGDGTTFIDANTVRIVPTYALFLWGRWPELEGLPEGDRRVGYVRTYDAGVYFTVQPLRADLPAIDEQERIARDVLKTTLAPVTTREVVPGVMAIERLGEHDFFARFTRIDGGELIASCFGGTCKVDQIAWRDGLAFGFTVGQDQARNLPAIEAKVRARLNSFVIVR